ncbi:MFS transporter [Micromonospora sp. CA-263727]|uniref:MFS transporter n=1 Tax=Micromonospora sp. CA-263727 TaxID=3239967 RepID=UPI003D8F9D56
MVTAGRHARVGVYAAGAVSAFGTQMTMLALPWLVLESTGSATRTGLVFAVQVLPMAVLGFVGGSVLQHLGARRTMLLGDLTRAPLVALVPLLHSAGLLELWVLLGLVMLIGLCGVPYAAAQRVLTVTLIGGDDPRALTRAYGALDGIYNVAAVGGPAAAGALIVMVGPTTVLWLDAASYLVSFLVLLLLVPRSAASATAPADQRGPLSGLRFLRRDTFLGQAVISTVLFGFALRSLAVTLPVLAFLRFGQDARTGGLLVAGSGAGALAGSLLTYLVATRIAPAPLARVAMVLVAAPLWLLLLPTPPTVLIVAVAISSAAVTVSNAPFAAIISRRVPEQLLPSVLQTVITISNIAGPLGLLLTGVLIERAGIWASLALVATIATVAATNALFALVRLERNPTVPTPERALTHA